MHLLPTCISHAVLTAPLNALNFLASAAFSLKIRSSSSSSSLASSYLDPTLSTDKFHWHVVGVLRTRAVHVASGRADRSLDIKTQSSNVTMSPRIHKEAITSCI